ncbi:MAG: hypothetical protein LBK06_10810 [Planctomycetaceae bacterium]|nr:hypothetical protein [Planctomycetaceae bacterium]
MTIIFVNYTEAVLKFAKLNTVAQQREAVTRGRSLLPYRLRYIRHVLCVPCVPYKNERCLLPVTDFF